MGPGEAPLTTLSRIFLFQDWSLSAWTVLLLASEVMALLTIPSVLLQRRGQPLSALSWFLTMIALPFFGVLAWWGIGRSHLTRKRRRRRRAHWEIHAGFASLDLPGRDALAPFPMQRLPLPESDGVFPPVGGNSVELLADGPMAYDRIKGMIAGASHHLHLLFYAWENDRSGRRFRDLLAERAREGVEVRLLCDALGSSSVLGAFMRPLRDAGGKVAFFSPTRYLRRALSINFRNHRKIAIADGCAAYTGGFNIGDAYAGTWRDAGLLLRGPVVAQLQEVFADDWYFTTRENLAEGAYVEGARACDGIPIEDGDVCSIVAGGPDMENNITQDAFFIAVTEARERVWITTPYLIPTGPMQVALRTAVYRGVDVRVLVPRTSDQLLTAMAGRSYYPTLLSGGIRVFEFLPAMLHAKVWVLDGDLSIVGTANLDTRSFKLNFETSCFVRSPRINGQLASLFLDGLKESEEVTAEKLRRRNRAVELAEAALNLLSPLL
jgi:cardiolipin synthase A/B